jgi:hypothetical protein
MQFILISIILYGFGCHTPKAASNDEPTPEGSTVVSDSLPVCVKVLIEKFKSEPLTNPPRKIYLYQYNDKKVYYVPAICCDNYSDLYNDSCRIMGHPDGGFTGKGDKSLPDFNEKKSGEKLLWEDTRK